MECDESRKIFYLDRVSKKILEERVYGRKFLEKMYLGNSSPWMLPWICCYPFASKMYGLLQKSRLTKCKVKPFIKEFDVDETEFLHPVETFQSFNDFFIRKLQPKSRPIASGNDVAILPADGRYLVFPHIQKTDGFLVKEKKFVLGDLLQDEQLASMYEDGAMVIARLCPTDYHRYHFPCSCIPSVPVSIEGDLYSVNPLALRKKIEILVQNKRQITRLQTSRFGQVLFLEIGATFVGSIHQTFSPLEPYAKGDEKGFFSFGGSCLILLFEPNRILLDQDLIDASAKKLEVRGLMGQTLGRSLTP